MSFAAQGPRDPLLLRAAAVDRPAVVTIPNVPILEAGEDWPLSTGPHTFTAEDIAAAVAAQDDPFVRTGVLKLGHVDKRFDGQPCFGKLMNLRASADGQTLYADLAGVPAWMADILPFAYPQRSIEGAAGWTSPTGKEHALVITGLALLGETDPAISTLEDLQVLWSDIPVVEVDGVSAKLVMASGANPRRRKNELQAAVEVEDVRRSFYEDGDMIEALGTWSWVRAVRLTPADLIVEGEDGDLYRVPYTINADETVDFGEPVTCHIEYVDDTTETAVAASRAVRKTGVATFASRDDSRNGVMASGPNQPTKENKMDPKEIRTRLGLAEDATDAEVKAKLVELTAEVDTPPEEEEVETPPVETPPVETPPVETPPVDLGSIQLPEGVTVVDTATLESLKMAASKGETAFERQRVQDRDAFLAAAVAEGKFPPARKAHYAAMFDKDPAGTAEFITKTLAAGTIPVTERGNGAGVEGTDNADAGYDESWLTPGERQRIAAAKSSN